MVNGEMVKETDRGSGEFKLETITSYLLILGVIASLLLEVAGMISFDRLYHSISISNQRPMFLHGDNFFAYLGRIFNRGESPLSIYLMMLGTTVLILTPYLRALLSVMYFASRKNVKYFFITAFVLIILTVSLILH